MYIRMLHIYVVYVGMSIYVYGFACMNTRFCLYGCINKYAMNTGVPFFPRLAYHFLLPSAPILFFFNFVRVVLFSSPAIESDPGGLRVIYHMRRRIHACHTSYHIISGGG